MNNFHPNAEQQAIVDTATVSAMKAIAEGKQAPKELVCRMTNEQIGTIQVVHQNDPNDEKSPNPHVNGFSSEADKHKDNKN